MFSKYFRLFPSHFRSFPSIFPIFSYSYVFQIIFSSFPRFFREFPQMYGFLTSTPRSLGSLGSVGSLRGVPPCLGLRRRGATAPSWGLARWTPLAALALGRRRVANMAKVVPRKPGRWWRFLWGSEVFFFFFSSRYDGLYRRSVIFFFR